MKWLRLAFLLFASCSKPNPHSCVDGICNDPSLPFCDVEGTLGGEPKECIGVVCTANEFATCREDDELRCNATGNNYDTTRCELGCDEETSGCRLCEPGETRCTNGKVAQCDAAGNAAIVTECPLGCFEDQPRCRKLAPSNQLGMYLDAATQPPEMNLENAVINTSNGSVTINGVTYVPEHQYLAGNGTGPSIRVFVVASARLKNVTVASQSADQVSGPAIAIVATGPIVVEGRLTVLGTAGGLKEVGCRGGLGYLYAPNGEDGAIHSRASGGGAHATNGAAGGSIGSNPGGAGGEASGTDSLEPLRGGCPAGGLFYQDTQTSSPFGVAGGGAIQLSSEVSVEVNGVIDVRGAQGVFEAQSGFRYMSGGGAGGGILLEAPKVTLEANARLVAKGGGGAAPDGTDPLPPTDDAAPTPGNVCPGTCPDGGAGAAPNAAAQPGQPSPSATGTELYSGGGGGGLGRLRINTRDATYTKANTAVEAAMTTSSLLKTR